MRKRILSPRTLRRTVAAGGLAVGSLMSVHGQTMPSVGRLASSVIDTRWQTALDAFSQADQAQAPQPGGVLFVGSSSIRLWTDLERSFEAQPIVVKRGFGGSRLSDCTRHLQRLVLPYKPRLVVVYAGDNDLAEGASPREVFESFVAFAKGVHAELPDTRIAYLSIKPSPLREALMPSARETNRLIEAYSATNPHLDYIDVFSKMLGPDNRPRDELYAADRLHLNQAGYALWRTEILPHLVR